LRPCRRRPASAPWQGWSRGWRLGDGGLGLSGLSGFFPTDLRVARIAYSDREGPWLTVENARLRWSFTSLLGGRLRVELISADRVAVLRPPLPGRRVKG
jgi:autotransporter translocation and assembly factor TamB